MVYLTKISIWLCFIEDHRGIVLSLASLNAMYEFGSHVMITMLNCLHVILDELIRTQEQDD